MNIEIDAAVGAEDLRVSTAEHLGVSTDDITVESASSGGERRLLSTNPWTIVVSSGTMAFANHVNTVLTTLSSSPAMQTSFLNTIATHSGISVATLSSTITLSPPVSTLTATSPMGAVCGDGNLEALTLGDNGRCPQVGSQTGIHGGSLSVKESCDVLASAQFGAFINGCGGDTACLLETDVVGGLDLPDRATAAEISQQRIWGLTTSDMQNAAFDPYDATSGDRPYINPCLYSTAMENGASVAVDAFVTALRCNITHADRVKYTTLANCYNSDPLSTEFGKRLTGTGDPVIQYWDATGSMQTMDQGNNFQLYGHKCNELLNVVVKGATGGLQSWIETYDQGDGFTVLPRSGTGGTTGTPAEYDSMYPLCFQISDPSWPSVSPSSSEFLAQLTRLQYQVICDPYDQDESYGFMGCEDGTAYAVDPATGSHRCTRLGNRINPCDPANRLWSLYSCDGDDCQSLEALSSTHSNAQMEGSDGEKKGVVYTFEHDSMPDKNKFECTTKDFDNEALQNLGFLHGDATEAQSKHICATGGQGAACDAGLGEIVHFVDTCHSGTPTSVEIAALEGNAAFDASDAAKADVQTYTKGCGRQLRIRINKAVAGQMMLRVTAKSYNTAVEEGDASKGYTYWTSKLMPVSIEAKVRDLEAVHNTVASRGASLSLSEGEDLQFFHTGSAGGSPFADILTASHADTNEQIRNSKFSRSTRGHVEFIECSHEGGVLAVENDDTVPRFSIDIDSAWGSGDGWYSDSTGGTDGRYHYFSGNAADGATTRTYELQLTDAYVAPAIHQLHEFKPVLGLRSATNALGGESDSFHEGYLSADEGLCLKTRLHLYEPSSCSHTSITSDPYNIRAFPVNALIPVVTMSQSQFVWGEDASVPLKINVGHTMPAAGDSKMWYFSHLEIEDMYAATADEQRGSNFDLFSYGNTRGATSGGQSAAIGTEGITKDPTTGKWVTYANTCTRHIAENPGSGGFSDPSLDLGAFSSAEECLNDARRVAQAIWGCAGGSCYTGGGSEKVGVWLRPFRKSTKNIQVRVTAHLVDGSSGWHADNPAGAGMIITTAATKIHLLHTPHSTRYDQEEVRMQPSMLLENGATDVTFNSVQTDGIQVPMSYRDGQHVCTYVHNSGADVDEVDTTHADHDLACDPSISPAGGCSSSVDHEVLCVESGAVSHADRGIVDHIIIFDESDGMALPEGAPYQPAGQNAHAAEDQQWYQLVASSSNGASIDSIGWCDDETATSYTPGSAGDAVICTRISDRGTTHDDIDLSAGLLNTPVAQVAAVTNTAGETDNFWVISRTSADYGNALPRDSISFSAKSDFNTIDSTQDSTAIQVNLRLIATLRDRVVATDKLMEQINPSWVSGDPIYEWTARSTSDASQGEFTVEVNSVRQVNTLEARDTMAWADGSVSLLEERNDHSRAEVPAARDWGDVATTNTITLDATTNTPDCTDGEPSSTFCADRVAVTEQNNFHDQHIGRVSIGACVRTIGEATCHPAGGLFNAQVALDNGQVVSVGDATSPLDDSPSGTTSQCTIEFSSSILSGAGAVQSDVDAVRGSRCVLVPKVDDIGGAGGWENQKLWKVLTNSGLTQPLAARYLKSRMRFTLPEKWSNDVEFEFSMIIGNDDRDAPSMETGHNSPELTWVVRPQSIAEEPVMWIETDLTNAFSTLGAGAGTRAMGMVDRAAGNYVDPAPILNLDGDGAMTTIDVVAGYQHQVMVKVGTAATDVDGMVLVPPLVASPAGYEWDDLRHTLSTSGERVYLTISSKYDDMFASGAEEPQRFCAMLCPPGQAPCSKADLQRLAPLEDADDFETSDVNCDGATCDDNHARDSSLQECPSFTPGATNNPGSRYSYKCNGDGTCSELQYLYIQYPADQIKDDLLEICAWSRNDYRSSGSGYQHSCITMNVRVAPAITLASVGFDNIPVDISAGDAACDEDNSSVDCPHGSYGAPLQDSQTVTVGTSIMSLELFETDLYGAAPDSCEMDNGGDGSQSSQGVNCGARFPISFPSETDAAGFALSLAAPVGIKMTIRVDSTDPTSRITTTELAQALRLVCTPNAMAATNARTGQCNGIMSAVVGSDELVFFDLDASGDVVVDGSGDPVVTSHPANRLTWTVGENMSPKEVLVRGGDTSLAWDFDHYSFQNDKCEQSRKFVIELEHQLGYTPAIVDSRRSTVEVVVRDDDFFGSLALGQLTSGAIVELASDTDVTGTKLDWETNGFTTYLIRSRTAAEMGAGADIPLKAIKADVELSFTTFGDDEFDVKVCDVDLSTLVESCPTSTIPLQQIRADNMRIQVDFAATTTSDAQGVVAYKSVRFFKRSGSVGSCATGQPATVAFSLQSATYDQTGGPLDGTAISGCGDRNPVSLAAQLTHGAEYTVVVDAQQSSPFVIDFAGFRQSTGFEGGRATPLVWNQGLDGTFVRLTETEHNQCQPDGSGFKCADREFRAHICRELRDSSWTSWGGGSPVTTEFFVQVDDNSADYAQIGDHYSLDCPDDAAMQNIKNAYAQNGLNTLQCTRMAVETDAGGNAISCASDPSKCLTKTRLLWTVQTGATMGRDLFLCPTSTSNGDSNFEYLPYATFRNRDDAGLINLSRRPSLVMVNSKKESGITTCAYTGDHSILNLRIEDDEMFAVDNAQIDAEMSENRAEFSAPLWDSSQGRLKVDVKLPYFGEGQEKTIVNVGLGGCAKDRWVESGGSFNAGAGNPLSSFGTCDMLINGLNGKIASSTSNADAFSAVYGESSYQTSNADYAAGSLFGNTNANNYLFTALNTNPGGGTHTEAWSVDSSTIDTYGNSDMTDKGFTATFSATIQQLQACQDYLGSGVSSVSIDEATGDTVYSFTMSQTQVTAMRKGDVSYPHWSAACTETDYELRVSNSMFALSGIGSNDKRNSIYVVEAAYTDTDLTGAVCSPATCDATIGPEFACPTAGSDTLVKALTYDIHLDMRDVANDVLQTDIHGTQSRTEVVSYFGVADITDVAMDSNCYGAGAVSATTDLVSSGSGVTRTKLVFATKCSSLMDSTSGQYVADTFASCASDAALATEFSFDVRLYECNERAHLANPTAHNDCQKLPTSLRVNIAMAHTENPVAIQHTVAFDKLQRFYRTYDHRDVNDVFRPPAQIAAWRESNIYTSSVTEPYVSYSPQSMIVASLGFVQGSALEGTMTTGLKKVRMCRFREYCSMPSVAPQVPCGGVDQPACAPVCTQANTMTDKTHSPYAQWARNTKLADGTDRGCADPNAAIRCQPTVYQTATPVPEFTCDRAKWEDFLVAEGQAILADSALTATISSELGVSVLTIGSIATAFEAVVEAQLVVDHGATTQRAEDVHGNCEKDPEVVNQVETVEGGVELTHMFPKDGSAGVCTCKGQRAYNYKVNSGSTDYPYRASENRKVVYDSAEGYSSDVYDPANLQVCSWRNSPHHASTAQPLQSNDQFVMSTQNLQVGATYFVEMEATQYDHAAFAGASSGYDQFGSARRLLHTPLVMPHGVLHRGAPVEPQARRLLALDTVDADMRQQLHFPQGMTHMTQAVQPAYSSSSSGGIVITSGTTVLESTDAPTDAPVDSTPTDAPVLPVLPDSVTEIAAARAEVFDALLPANESITSSVFKSLERLDKISEATGKQFELAFDHVGSIGDVLSMDIEEQVQASAVVGIVPQAAVTASYTVTTGLTSTMATTFLAPSMGSIAYGASGAAAIAASGHMAASALMRQEDINASRDGRRSPFCTLLFALGVRVLQLLFGFFLMPINIWFMFVAICMKLTVSIFIWSGNQKIAQYLCPLWRAQVKKKKKATPPQQTEDLPNFFYCPWFFVQDARSCVFNSKRIYKNGKGGDTYNANGCQMFLHLFTAFIQMLLNEFWNLLFGGYIVGVTLTLLCIPLRDCIYKVTEDDRFVMFCHVVSDHSFFIHIWMETREFLSCLGKAAEINISENTLSETEGLTSNTNSIDLRPPTYTQKTETGVKFHTGV
jgi:hypothetical protein